VEEINGEMGLDFSPGRRESVWDRDLQIWGNKRGNNVPDKLELSVQNFYPGLKEINFVNSFYRYYKGKICRCKTQNKHLGLSHSIIHQSLNMEGEMFVCGKDFKHQCDWKSPETHTHPRESVPAN